MITPNDFRFGTIIRLEGEIYEVIGFQHIKIAQRRAFVKTKLKNLLTGRVIEKNLDSEEPIEELEVERRKGQFLYREEETFYFMDLETYETFNLSKEALGDKVLYLKENLELNLLFVEGKFMEIELPFFVELMVVETEPDFKGDTASGGGKPAKLETGLVIDVPYFIVPGNVVRIDTRSNTYIERVK
jgi:elongation factor P|uniref:Elongation factor P n=1 Tax=candidate division WOR-3 bacterium TaxID=2052148 RepID=A0A7C3UXE2_UNCW3